MKRKASLQLSTNFIVMLILGIASFALGMAIILSLGDDFEEMGRVIDQGSRDQIERLLMTGGQQVAIPFNSVDVQRGDLETLAFGIKNDFGNEERFRVEYDCVGAYGHEGDDSFTDGCTDLYDCDGRPCNNEDWVVMANNELEVDGRSREMRNLIIVIPRDAEPGRYFYRMQVEVLDDEQGGWVDYGVSRRFSVYVR